MRGFLNPAVRSQATDQQKAFSGLSRHRRSKLARAANTNLLKADQWSNGGLVSSEIASALEGAIALAASKKKKS